MRVAAELPTSMLGSCNVASRSKAANKASAAPMLQQRCRDQSWLGHAGACKLVSGLTAALVTGLKEKSMQRSPVARDEHPGILPELP